VQNPTENLKWGSLTGSSVLKLLTVLFILHSRRKNVLPYGRGKKNYLRPYLVIQA